MDEMPALSGVILRESEQIEALYRLSGSLLPRRNL